MLKLNNKLINNDATKSSKEQRLSGSNAIKSKYWEIGKRGLSNKWITFYAYLCLKYKEKAQLH